MTDRAQGRYVAILASDGFEEAELFEPKKAVEAAGGIVEIISDKSGEIEANRHREKGDSIKVDKTLDEADADQYDTLMIPGGLFSPDHLRTNDKAIAFVNRFFERKRPVAAICHGPQLLIEADAVKGRRMTSVPAIRTDLANAGAEVVDEEVVVDSGLVTSRTPKDLEAFCDKLVEETCEGEHARQAQSA
ncbi:MAG: type 1 glutamine amidotransferase domain-containing protein [Oceanicaulis sp.]